MCVCACVGVCGLPAVQSGDSNFQIPHLITLRPSVRQNCHAWCPHSVCTSRKRLNSSSVRLGCGGKKSDCSTEGLRMTVQIQTLRMACQVIRGSPNPSSKHFQTFSDFTLKSFWKITCGLSENRVSSISANILFHYIA